MMAKRISSKIGQHHLDRKAVVYVRQSSDRQVQQNLESRRLQYALADWAREMGWRDVQIIDADLGASATVGSPDRNGFDRLLEMVVRGEVGIILCREASRLSRTDKDWCRIFEVCPLLDTLIGDGQQVYDLNLTDDQLVMGIMGTMTVVEYRVLQGRLRAAAEAKAQRGELERMLPPGYVRDGDGRSVKDPDRRVGEAIDLVFRKFRELWSVRQTFLWFHCEGIALPVNKKQQGRMRVVWQLPTYAFIKNLLQNPYYAGVYVWGRRQTERLVDGGKVRKRQTGHLPPERWKVLLRDHHEAYIDWEVFEENQRRVLARQLEQVEYEALRAFEQYDQVDPRNRLVAAQLEERWNDRLEAVKTLKQALERMQQEPPSLSAAQRQRILTLGERFAQVWNHQDCSVEVKKKIIRSVVEEVVVGEGESPQDLRFIVHWKGGVHTQFEMARVRVPGGRKTAADDVEVIRKMAARYGDDDIARVLNKLGRRTGMDKRWSMQRVARVRRQHSIPGRSRTQPDPEVLTQHTAAKYCAVSQTTIKKLVAAGILPMTQVVPWAPWEIRRSDLDSQPVRQIVERLRKTGKLVLTRGASPTQQALFPKNSGD